MEDTRSQGRMTGFVSHYDCSRHDTGWDSADHQGRLPSIMRAVYGDMLTLHDALVQIEGRHATEDELLLVHTGAYVEQVREWVGRATAAGAPIEIEAGLFASPATWAASLAAIGSTLQGVDAVLDGRVRNAFCAIRPAAADATEGRPGRRGFFNQIAVATRYLARMDVGRLLVVEWEGSAVGVAEAALAEKGEVRVMRVGIPGATSDHDPGQSGRWPVLPGLPAVSIDGEMDRLAGDFIPDFVLLSADFTGLDATGGGGSMHPSVFHAATSQITDYADAACGGRLVSVLGGGSSPELGPAVVNHVRALAGIEAVA